MVFLSAPVEKNINDLKMADASSTPFIYMAPLRGITDALFRQVYCKHFKGINAAVAPFINPQRKSGLTDKLLADVSPGTNNLHLIPQLLNTDGDDFLALAQRLYDLGYNEINWNLGCPVPMVAKKNEAPALCRIQIRLQPSLTMSFRDSSRNSP